MELNIMQNFFRALSTRRLFSFGAAIVFIFFALVSLSAPGQIAYAAGTVTGTVYRDYNADGDRDTREAGLGGITVKAFNATGVVVQTTTTFPVCVGVNQPVTGCTGVLTPAPGTYTLASMANGPYRIEFTTTNTGLQPGAFGSGNGTTVQLVDVTAGNVTNVNASMNAPRDYCQSNPDLIVPCYADGNQGGTDFTLYSHDYTENNADGVPAVASLVGEATEQQIGSTYGLAYRSTTNTLYAAAYLKRNAGFDQSPTSTNRPGQIWSVTPGGATDGTAVFAIPNNGGTAGTDLHSDFDPSNNNGDFDSEAFPLVGKASLGDIELNGDETILYVVNLNDLQLYQVVLATSTVSAVGSIPSPSPACTGGTARPFGLGWRDDKLYIGGVCDAQSSQNAANMRAYVLQWTSGTAISSATTVLDFPLNFDRECLNVGGGTSAGLPDCRAGAGVIERPHADWRPWTDTFATMVDINDAGDNDTFSASSGNGGYPQPMLSDIVFDGDDIILGFRDRTGDMLGHQDPGPTESHGGAGEPVLLNTTGAGDTYRANPNASSGWTIENDTNSVPAGIFGPTTAGAASPQGPGGGEFYYGDNHNNHDETAQGGLAQVPGNNEVAMTVADPEVTGADLHNGGTSQMSNIDDHPSIAGTDNEGMRVRNVEVFDYFVTFVGDPVDTDRFAKANGLGDLEALCNAAPLEVGNRVWRDTDGDGIQDPGEMPLAGVRVRLFRAGVAVGTALTDSNGTYYFVSSAAADGNTNDNIGQVSEVVSGRTGVARATAYEVRVEPAQGNNGNLLNGLSLTTQNAADAGSGDAGANADARDSDATTTGGNYVVAFTSGGAGNNNHTFDLGFAPLGSIGNRVWRDEDSNGYQDEGEDGIANVIVELKNPAGTVLATTRTDSQGYYLFTGLAGATYFVEVQSGIPAGMTQTTVYPNPGSDLYNQDQTTNANGYQVVLPAGTDNLTADFGYNWNPTSNVDNGGTTGTTAALGDRVWIDTNGNGRQDAGEVGVSGVTVTLTGPGPDFLFSTTGDNTTATTTTDANGYYIFDELAPGAYTVTVTSAAGASHAILTAGQYTQTGDPDHWGTTGTNNDNTTTTPVVLGPGDVFLDADFGYQPAAASLGSVGNFVWFDRDADGVGPTVNGEAHGLAPGTDNTEEGIGGVSVALIRDLDDDGTWDAGEPIIATMYTSDGTQDVDGDGTVDPKGFYRFRSLSITDGAGATADDYLVWVNDTARVLDGLRATYDLDGSAVPASGLVTGFGISRVDDLGGAVINHDFGYTPDNSGEQSNRTTLSPDANTGSIGNYVWLDIDGDGNGPNNNGDGTTAPEPGEVGIEGVRVLLYQDSDGDGVLDAGEPLIAVTTTSPEGYYLFTNLVTTDGTGTDDYIVLVDTTTLPGGLTQTYDASAPTTDSRSAVANLTTTPVLTQDFGYRGTGTVGNLVWNDVNADGNVDAGENGINGVTLDIYFDTDGDGKIDPGEPKLGTTTTAGGGAYLFSGLPTDDGVGSNAQYIVDVTDTAGVLSGYFHSIGNQSQASDNESKFDPFAVTLTPGTPNVLTVDFGYYVLPAALGNYVWRDTNGDGDQDAGEPGINGVVVQLTITYPGANGVIGGGDDTVSTLRTTTGDDPNTSGTQFGWYGFDNLLQDEDYNTGNAAAQPSFSISVVTSANTGVLSGLASTLIDQGGNDLLDADNTAGVTATPTEGQRTITQQASGGSEATIASYDFGYTPLGSIGNRVWVDEDSNGYQDEGEDGIANVVVELKNSGGTVIATTRTDSQGYYLFPNLPAATYFVEVLSGIPAGMTQTTVYPNAGSDLYNQDQTTNPNGYQIVLLGSQDNLSADFGYNWNPTSNVDNGGATNTTAALGDRVWIDTNGNGRQDAGEVGVFGVTVTLTGPGPDFLFSTTGDNTTATTTTDANGYYIFDGLTPGAYTATVTSAAGASHAILTAGQYNQTGDPDHWGTTGTNNDNTTTTPVVLVPGDVFLDADFGYQPSGASLGSVGNFVWFDRDADGVGPTVSGEAHGGAPGTDNTEEGIGGVSVALIRDLDDDGTWDAGEPIIATMFTSDGTQDVDGDGTVDYKGFYRFRGLSITDGAGNLADDYLVWVNDTAHVLDGLVATYDLDGSGAPASGLVTGLGISYVNDLAAAAVINHDFGYTPDNSGQQASFTTVGATNPGVIGNYVWLDIDGDGNGPNSNGDGTTLPETGEIGIANVRVNLYQDTDNSGTINAGDVLIATTLTSPEGYYLFPNLVITDGVGTDDYIVQVDTTTLPGGLTQTYDATAPTTDSTSRVQDLTATPVLTQDFGYRGTGTVGNLVWNDVNADGNVDAGENGINGVTLDLYYDRDGDGKIDPGEPKLGTTVTAGGGAYLFSGLPTDDGGGNAQYIVDVTDTAGVLSGYFHSIGNQSQASDNESKFDPYAVTLTTGTPNVLTVDFGYYVLPAALGNYVWRDTDGDGIQDAGEPGINGVVVQLTITYPGANGVIGGGDDTVSTLRTTTGDDPNTAGTQTGWYGFDNLLQDEDYNTGNAAAQPSFSISVVTAANTGVLTGLGSTPIDQGGNDLLDADNTAGVTATPTEGQRTITQQASGGSEATIASYDFGYTPLGSIGNRVWVDEDSNGYQDEGEDGIPNVIVELRNSGGTVIATTRTDSQGYYLFPNLAAGTYSVRVQSGIPAGMSQTTVYPNAGSDLYNQDQSPANGYQIVLASAQDNLSADFGYNWNPTSNVDNGGPTNTTATIGDRVWIDTNGNGRQDAGEVGVSGVTVTLTGPGPDFLFSTAGDNTTATTTTDANGYYIFDGLAPGAYTVTVTSAAGASHAILTAGQYTQTGDADHWGTTGTNNDNTTTTPVVLGPGDVFLDADFGYQPSGASLGSVGNFVWFDRDADGIGPTVSGEAHGGAPGTDNTEEGIGGVSVSLIRDTDGDGTWDAGEPIIATMFTSDGTQDVDGDGTVDYKGFYRFRALQIADGTGSDDYLVWVNDTGHVLDGLLPTYDVDGSGTPASGLVTGLGISVVANLTGTAVTNQDFGYTPDNSGQQASFTTVGAANPGVIGNYVWLDIDGDGNGPNGNGDGTTAPETGEIGIANVRVNLYLDVDNSGTINAGDVLVGTTLTSPEGYYLFPNLVITDGVGTDDYMVQVDTTTLPGGLTQTYDATGVTTDSTSRVQDLAGTVLTQDFGYRGTGTIGNLVWNDVNADGDQDAGETGINGVTLNLYYDRDGDGKIDPGEPIVGTTTTAGGGAYLFSGLPTDDGGGNAQYIVDVTDTAGMLSGYFHSLGTNPNTTTDTAGAETQAISHNDPVPVTLTTGVPNNRNADFGYYVLPAGVGNFVFNDRNADGIQDPDGIDNVLGNADDEVGIDGVVVQLTITYPGANGVIGGGDDTVTTLRTTTGDNPNQAGTQAGWYSFDNLLQDEDYNNSNAAGQPSLSVSVVTADNTGALANLVKTNVDQGGSDFLDSDNHAGVTATATEGLRSVDQLNPASGEPTRASYDFGYVAPVNLGDRIWYDINNDGIFDADGVDNIAGNADDEVGINGVVVELYRDTNGDGDYDAGVDTLIGTQTTAGAGAAAGTYNFTLMTPSITATLSTHYFVLVRESNFTTGGGDDALVGYQNSSTVTDQANSDVNSRDHGRVIGTLGSAGGFVVTQNAAGNNSGAAIVTPAGEPTNDGDGNNGNLTIDFGFYRLQISGTVFNDANNNGNLDTGENSAAIVNGRTVRLYNDTNSNGTFDGGDTLVATTTTNATGDYSFTNLAPGKYIVNLALPSGYHSTIDTFNQTDANTPNTGADNNDNGFGNTYNNTYSHAFDLNPGDTTTNLGNTLTYSSGTTGNTRTDFGMSQSPTAVELGAVTAEANADNSVTFRWETLNETTALGFNVQRGESKDGEFANLNAELIAATTPGAITGNSYEYVDATAETGNTYYYRLQVLHSDNTTLESEAIEVTVGEVECKGKTDAPILATPEDKAKLQKGKLEFVWNVVNCAKKYQIELRADSPDGTLIAEEKTKDTTFSIKKLDQGTTYYWRVSACNAKGKCVASEWWSFKIKKDKE